LNIFRFCIHRIYDGSEAQIVLEDARAVLHDAIATRFRESGRVARWGGAEAAAHAAIDEVADNLDEIARDTTVRL
jgi:hypothetical protein